MRRSVITRSHGTCTSTSSICPQCLMRIRSDIYTSNGKSFTDRFTVGGERKPSGCHLSDQERQAHGIEHQLIKLGRAQMNDMGERFNGCISDVLVIRRYDSSVRAWNRRSNATVGYTTNIFLRKHCTTSRQSQR